MGQELRQPLLNIGAHIGRGGYFRRQLEAVVDDVHQVF